MEVKYFVGCLFLSQTKYRKNLLTCCKMLEASQMSTPMPLKSSSQVDDDQPTDPTKYRWIVGALQLDLNMPRYDLCCQ